MRRARAFIVFSAAYAVLYLAAMYYNLALFTYYPVARQFYPLVPATPQARGPAMFWYGWIATATLGALALSVLSLVVPERWATRLWPGWSWVAPTAVFLTLIVLLRGWFIRV
jgi:hypothetical protein